MAANHRQAGLPSDAATPSPLFCSAGEAATTLGLSEGGLALARQRREVDGLYVAVGRRVLWSRPAIRLRALGITTPEQIGRLCRGLGVGDLEGLLEFLGGEAGRDVIEEQRP